VKTLNDNWFEDRFQPPCASGPSRQDDHTKKTTRAYESEIAYVSPERYDVLNRISRIPVKESYATPDDGFREKMRTSTVDYAHPRSRKEFLVKQKEKASFITHESVPEVCFEERRPIPGNIRGFGAALNRHEESHEQRHWSTTHGDTYGSGSVSARTSAATAARIAARSARFNKIDPATLEASGVSTQREEERTPGVKVGLLCGEEFRDRGEPACDTRTQRSWLYAPDASLNHIAYGGTKPPPPTLDNELSVPIGEGAMKKVRDDLKARQGRLFRTATQITKGRDKRPGMAVFKDDP